jgi:Protein of unknown function (DUF2946)
MSPGPRKSRTLGAWLALLALYVQVLLPMLIAVELRLADAGGPASAAFAMCGGGHGSTGAPDGGAAGPPGTGDSHSRHCCPLCTACTAIGASYIAAAEIFLAVPAGWTSIVLRASGLTVVPRSRVATYEARAPPPILGLKPFGRSLDRPNGAYLFNAKFIPVHARKPCLLLPIDAA